MCEILCISEQLKLCAEMLGYVQQILHRWNLFLSIRSLM